MTPENAQVLLHKYVERTGVCDSRVCSWARSLPIFRQQLDLTDEKVLALFSLLTETIEIDR
jgi:hypothetical protein